jgi:transcriptional regulator with XRE-family HTH domain
MNNQARLRDIMQRESLTSRAVATLVGVHPVTVRRWMSGQSRVPDAVMMVLDALPHAARPHGD